MRGQTGTSIPRRENELRGTTLSPVTTYHMTPEEIAAKYGPPVVKKASPKFDLTRDQYLAKRAAGKSRRDIMLENCGNVGSVLKGFLLSWGLSDPQAEKEEMDKLYPEQRMEIKEQTKRANKSASRKGRTNKHNLTKEFIQAEFAAGKTARQIEIDKGMPLNSLFYYLRKWGLRSPYQPGSLPRSRKKQQPVEKVFDHVVSRTALDNVAFTPDEIALLKLLRSAIDKVVTLHG